MYTLMSRLKKGANILNVSDVSAIFRSILKHGLIHSDTPSRLFSLMVTEIFFVL